MFAWEERPLGKCLNALNFKVPSRMVLLKWHYTLIKSEYGTLPPRESLLTYIDRHSS